jgi:hypothetical protein
MQEVERYQENHHAPHPQRQLRRDIRPTVAEKNPACNTDHHPYDTCNYEVICYHRRQTFAIPANQIDASSSKAKLR